MAIPIICGPGAITVLITLANDYTFIDKLSTTFICALLAIIFWIILKFGPIIAKFIGHEGMKIISRIMGLILAAMAVQMISVGMLELYHSAFAQ